MTLAVVPPLVLGENAKRQQQSIREIAQRRLLSARDARKGEREIGEAGSRASTANIHLMDARRKEGKVPGFAENVPVIQPHRIEWKSTHLCVCLCVCVCVCLCVCVLLLYSVARRI